MTRDEFRNNININSDHVGVDFRGCNEWIQEYSLNCTEYHYRNQYDKIVYYFDNVRFIKDYKREKINGIAMVMNNDIIYILAQENTDNRRYNSEIECRSLIRTLFPKFNGNIETKSQRELQEIIDSLFPFNEEESLNNDETFVPSWLN